MTGEQLRERRRRLGLTQAQLAEKFSTTNNTVARWEGDDPACPYPGMVELALDALDSQHALAVEPIIAQLEAHITNLQQVREQLARQAKPERK